MSRLDELIEKYCPDGVEYKALGELFNTRNGYTPSKSNKEYWTNGTVPWFRMEDIRENGTILVCAIQNVSERAVKGNLFPADSIIVATSATIGQHALIKVPSLANQRFTYLMLKENFKDQFDVKFLYYYCFKLDEYCKECLNQGNFAAVDMKRFMRFEFPLPPLPVQEEIVRILDTFTELEKELVLRRKQYEYYRDLLLDFKDVHEGGTNAYSIPWLADMLRNLCPQGVEYRKLGEVFNTRNGYTPSKSNKEYWTNGTVPWFRMEDIRKNGTILDSAILNVSESAVKKSVFPANSIIVATTATIGQHALIKVPSLANQQFTYLMLKENFKNQFDVKFLYYYCFKLDEYCKECLNQGNFAAVDMKKFVQFEFPLPPLAIQRRIVAILDRFDALCNDLTSGLPAEIALRRKQYEYYRDKLLTLRELKAF